jgi:hypothetical protein
MNSFSNRATLTSGSRSYTIYHLPALTARGFDLSRLPFSLKILLENLLRREDGVNVTAEDIEFLAKWDAKAEPSREIAYMPARVLMQDFTGVPAVVDLAAMRDAIKTLGGDPERVNPLVPAELVIDHSVQVDEFGSGGALAANTLLEFQRNRERYAFLKWGQTAFRNFSAVPPGMGICHQVNLEYLARVVFTTEIDGELVAYPDTVVGTDSHTTMINGLGVLGWGVGGIEAEAAMLGQPVSMLVPQVVGFRLTGKLKEGATATDLVRGWEIRRILWTRNSGVTPGRSRHPQQHGSRVRRHLRHLPGGRRDVALPAPDRPQRRAGCAGRGLLQRTGTLPHRQFTRSRLHADSGAGSGHRGAERGRAQAPAGPGAGKGRGRQLPEATAHPALSHSRAPGNAHGGEMGARSGDGRRGCGDNRASPLRRRSGKISGPRLGGDRGHYQLHQHLQPLGDDGRGSARQKGR